MIKLNRIGNKLGAVGLFGVLLSGGMVANQMVSESAINSANDLNFTQSKMEISQDELRQAQEKILAHL